jgi:hypothetical protein
VVYDGGMRSQSQPADSPISSPEPRDEGEFAPPHYVSFVLRCRTTADGQVRASVSEVRSGLTRSVADLDELPDLVRRWMMEDQDL